MRLASYLVGGAAVGAIGTGNDGMMETVFKSLQGTKKDIKVSMEQSEDALTKVTCLRDSGKKSKEQTIKEEEAKIDRIKNDLDLLKDAVLTDEKEGLANGIRDTKVQKQKEEERCKKLDDKRAAQLIENGVTITAVTEALATVEGNETAPSGGFLSTNSRIVTLLSAKLSPKHREAIVSKLAAASEDAQNPTLTGNKMGAIVALFKNILATLEDSKANLEAQKEKEADACLNKINDLQADIDDKQAEMNAGEKEKAAKEKRKKELEDKRDNAETIIKRMKVEIEHLEANLTEQKAQTEEDREVLPHMINAIESVLKLLKSKNNRRVLNAFLQTHSSTKKGGMDLVAQIETMITELIEQANKEIADTKTSVADCEGDGASNLEAATVAVKAADAARDKAKSARETSEQYRLEQEQIQKNLDELALAHDVELAQYDAVIESLEVEKKDNEAAENALKDAVAFMQEVESGGEHKAAFDNLTAILVGQETKFRESVARLTAEIHAQKTEKQESSDDYEETKTSLESDKETAESNENDANKDEGDALSDKATELKNLYGDDGDEGIYGAISAKQPQCDKWIRDGPTIIDNNRSAIVAYQGMKTLLENYEKKEQAA